MAKIKNQLVSGRLGDVIYKSWKGQPYVIAAPEIKESQSVSHIESKQLFRMCHKLGAAMYKIIVLRDHWEKTSIDASGARNKFFKFNRPRIFPGDISGVKLVNAADFCPVTLVSSNISPDGLSCIFNINSVNPLCKEISMQGIVQLTGPAEPGYEEYIFFPVVSGNYPPVTGEDMIISLRFTSQDIELAKSYNNKNILLNLAFKNLQGEAVKFSETKIIGNE